MTGHHEQQNTATGRTVVIVNVGGVERTIKGVNAAKFCDQLRDATDATPSLLDPANITVTRAVEQALYRTITGDNTYTLRGARAKRFADLLNKRMEDDPMIQWQSRPQQRAVHEAIFREVIQKGNDNG